ncbi:hypothetical protein [Streptomyces johnsoniae]|uniref:Uncharacterized protein n=1 Tax=Streptomyces johnsoniae TaxID=3075532 RepID=A0ABU2S4K3_9ACTN|nr:hypothetical protein [Streptomyces sp. DSM 41886]MDT0443912.1 hypothetical protein [Streptomyces sp. DSM 41886]
MADAMGVRDAKRRGQGPELWVRAEVGRVFLVGGVSGTLGA